MQLLPGRLVQSNVVFAILCSKKKRTREKRSKGTTGKESTAKWRVREKRSRSVANQCKQNDGPTMGEKPIDRGATTTTMAAMGTSRCRTNQSSRVRRREMPSLSEQPLLPPCPISSSATRRRYQQHKQQHYLPLAGLACWRSFRVTTSRLLLLPRFAVVVELWSPGRSVGLSVVCGWYSGPGLICRPDFSLILDWNQYPSTPFLKTSALSSFSSSALRFVSRRSYFYIGWCVCWGGVRAGRLLSCSNALAEHNRNVCSRKNEK